MLPGEGDGVSAADKPTGGDSFPDRDSGVEDKPFPGAPADREPAPELPRNTLSMEEVRAVHQRSTSNAEFEAAAKAHAQTQAADFPGSSDVGSPDPGSAGEGSTAVSGDGTDVPADRYPEGSTQPDSEPPPFPGAPADREPAPELPKSTLSMEEVSAVHQRSSSDAEFETMAAEYAAAGNGGDPGSDWDRVRPDAVQGPTEGADSDEWDSEDSGGRSQPDAAEQSRRVEDATVRESANEHNDVHEQSAENQSGGRDQVAEPVRERPTVQEHEPGSRPDTGAEQTDEQRWAAMEQRMQSAMEQKLEAALDGIKADYQAKLDEQKAEFQAAKEAIKSGYESRIRALEERLGAGERDQRIEPGRELDSVDRLEPTDEAGAAASERSEELGIGDTGHDEPDESEIDGRIGESARPEPVTDDRPESDLARAAKEGLGVAGAFSLVNPVLQMAVTADSARRTYNDLPSEDQYRVNSVMETFVTASGSMSPGTALAAVTASAVLPVLRGKMRDFIDKARRKD